MPEATPFNALGEGGNGALPNCLPKVNVTLYDLWSTASGYNKDDYDGAVPLTPVSIDASLVAVCKLYFNSRLAVVDGSYEDEDGPVSSVTEVQVGVDTVGDIIPEPKSRTCFSANNTRGQSSDGSVSVQIHAAVYRMYAGLTTNEDNFIGYGLRGGPKDSESLAHTISVQSQPGPYAYVDFGGFSNFGSTTRRITDNAYLEIGGIHGVFRCVATDGFGKDGTVDAALLYAESYEDEGGGRFKRARAEIVSMDFFTYPA
jgi:hypothetical protein